MKISKSLSNLLVPCLLFVNSAAHAAPSFDCAKAKTTIERKICDDKTLSDADIKLSSDFKAVIASNPDSKSALLQNQRQWIKERKQRCADASSSCLLADYSSRIEWLKNGTWQQEIALYSLSNHASTSDGICINPYG